jgi:hypothetical protein
MYPDDGCRIFCETFGHNYQTSQATLIFMVAAVSTYLCSHNAPITSVINICCGVHVIPKCKSFAGRPAMGPELAAVVTAVACLCIATSGRRNYHKD